MHDDRQFYATLILNGEHVQFKLNSGTSIRELRLVFVCARIFRNHQWPSGQGLK